MEVILKSGETGSDQPGLMKLVLKKKSKGFTISEASTQGSTIKTEKPLTILDMTSDKPAAKAKGAEQLFCICMRVYNENDEDEMMIECDSCHDWLHGRCIGLSLRLAADIETYFCPRCVSPQKQIVYKKRLNNRRNDYSDPNGNNKPIQAGTRAFVEQLLKRKFPDALENNIICKLNSGSELTVEYLEKNGFTRPILIEDKKELQFKMPDKNQISLTQIETIVGGTYEIDVIDVERQETFPMSISELNSYFETWPREKIYNLISFEISKTSLTQNITAPKIVYDISWASNNVWPDRSGGAESEAAEVTTLTNQIPKPEVQKYCLISAADSYTDFHIDFGGSSVWYHTIKGDKVFYLIEPTEQNLHIYENWLTAKNHSEIFLGDKVKNCYRFEIKEGSTIFLPTGWIHAVFTPYDSIVFGGNFLHSYNIPLQLKIYDMEMRLRTPDKFRFPAFETFQWYAAKFYAQKVKELNAASKCVHPNLLSGLKYLKETLKRWINSKNYYELHDYQVPRQINCEKLVCVMNRELAKADVISKSSSLSNSSETTSLKLKFKLNPKDLSSSTSQLVSNETKSKGKKKPKEILDMSGNEIEGIRVEFEEAERPPQQPPIRIVMKIPKTFSDTAAQLTQKIELPKNSVESNLEYESEHEAAGNEDDKLLNEIKNSYQDNDFFYPSITSFGTTARTSKKLQKSAGEVQSSSVDEPAEKQVRKRKLKPHAVEYLQAKNAQSDQVKPEAHDSLEELIDKNMGTASSTADDNDLDYSAAEDDDDDCDYEQEFKMKCEQNLKISKKLKKNSVKQQKKLQSQEANETGKSGEAAAKAAKRSNKKGYATTKQRLGKLLKLNRLINI